MWCPSNKKQQNQITLRQDNTRTHVVRVVWDFFECWFIYDWVRLGWNGTTSTPCTKSASDISWCRPALKHLLKQHLSSISEHWTCVNAYGGHTGLLTQVRVPVSWECYLTFTFTFCCNQFIFRQYNKKIILLIVKFLFFICIY